MRTSQSKTSFILGDTEKGVAQLITSGACPPAVKVHNNLGHATRLHEHFGDDSLVVIRMTGSEYVVNRSKSPAPCAVEWCEVMKLAFQACPWGYFEVGGPLAPADEWQRDFWLAGMNWMHARGYHGVVMTHGEGNPQVPSGGGDGWDVMRPVVQLAASYRFILGPQAYWIDDRMDMDDDWHALRILRVFRDYPGMFPTGTRILHSEWGIDLRGGDRGWKSSGCSAEAYRAGHKAASDKMKAAPIPAGVEFIANLTFALHDEKGTGTLWPDFNFWEIYGGMLEDIKAEQDETIPAPQPTPTPQNTMAVKTISRSGQNIRAHHSLQAPIVGDIDYGEVVYISMDEAGWLGQARTWCYVKTFDGQEGWAGAWMLMVA